MTRTEAERRAAQLLQQEPMTRHQLETSLGLSQQRVSEILRTVGAHVVGYKPAPRQGRPAPLYAVGETGQQGPRRSIGRVSSVWQLASMS
jgi:predicted ArsR family transcriptional regulator